MVYAEKIVLAELQAIFDAKLAFRLRNRNERGSQYP